MPTTQNIAAAMCLLVLGASAADATPQFARMLRVDCAYCHSAPPRLNETGLRFQTAGYRLDEPRPTFSTLPLAVWNTVDGEWRQATDLVKGFPSRVEIISGGRLGSRGSYFAEWRALSLSLAGNGRIVNRSGRFEDLFVRLPVTRTGALSLTAGQFRTLSQVDVSLRLSLSEPLLFSSNVPGPAPARSGRLTGLRAFSASGRQPGFRVEYQPPADPLSGWFVAATLPLAGELTIPLTEAASFELEARPKGAFIESFRRWGLTSLGGHVFIGDARRRIVTVVATHALGPRLTMLGGLGAFHASGITDTRFSVGAELTISRHLVGGARVDHRTDQGRDPAILLYGNVHFPFGPAAFRQAVRFQLEQRVQAGSHGTIAALSHVF